MKKIMSEKQKNDKDFWKPATWRQVGIIGNILRFFNLIFKNLNLKFSDANFLSIAFAGALAVIVSVSIYAFYNLYNAILKKFPSKHTEL